MGFRLASLRRTNVVMAPVCTCIIFVKDFSIYIECQPAVCVINLAGDNFQTCVKQFQLMCVKVFRIFVLNKTDDRHANDDIFGRMCANLSDKEDVDVLNEKYNDCFNSNQCCFAAVLRIMSTYDSMEDKVEMGLQKLDMPNFDDANLNVKDKRCTPAIDILSNFEKEMCRNGNNFQQDCEEFLEMMATNAEKENTLQTVTTTTTITAPSLINGQAQFPSETNEIVAGLEGDLLNQFEAMDEDNAVPTVQSAAMSYVQDCEANRKKCLQMERRIDRLTRRLKLKQSKLCGLHTSEQVSGLLDFCLCKFVDLQSNTHSDTTMDAYLKRLKRCSDQSCVPQTCEKFVTYFGSGTRETKNGRSHGNASVAPKFELDVHEHIEKISGELHAQIKAIASDFDSDITASSSGNDSLDEETPLLPDATATEDRSKKIPLNKRAIWRWLRNRASIAYRLSWLQSHMSALEYKIHHYTEMYKKLRCTKGQVILKNVCDQIMNGNVGSSSLPSSSTTSSLLTLVATAATATTMMSTTAPTITVKSPANAHVVLNGYHGSLAAVTTSPLKTDVSDAVLGGISCTDSDEQCSRTCPLLKSRFRKRSLIRLDALHPNGGISATRPKYSSVRCDCVPPITCVLCVARGPGVDLSNQHIYSTLLPVQSKIALLEPTYHPVLSFSSDISISTHVSTLLNNVDLLNVCEKTIENRTTSQTSVKRYYSNYKNTDEIRRANSEGTEFSRRKKLVRRPPNNSQNVTYGRSQLGKQRHSKLDKTLSLRKRRRKRLLSKRYKTTDNGLDESPDEGLYYKKEDVYSSQPGSPHSSHSSTVKDPTRRKRGQSFDIDNFIIPPNSTPATVVSKPQYKEILIPTWKVVTEKSFGEIDRSNIPDYIREDLSDEKVIKLHEMLELNERKKFRTNAIRHGRSRKRTDSCPETSEANTPERVSSPPASTNSESNDATVLSNVSAALPSTTTPNQSSTITTSAVTNTLSNKYKIPLVNKKLNDCDNSSVTEPASAETTPYELRVFPLSDEEYKELLASHLNSKMEDNQSDEERDNNNSKPNENENSVHSPCTESTDSVLEDPDDPDWMLQNEEVDRRAATEALRK